MDTIQNNVNEAIASLNAIRDKIVEKGVDVAEGTKPRLYANKVDDVFEAGKKAERDMFWDTFQDYGNRINYQFAFSYKSFNSSNFYPKYDINIVKDGASVFYNMEGEPFSFSQRLIDCGVKLDTSKAVTTARMFTGCLAITELPIIDLTGITNRHLSTRITDMFRRCTNLVTIEKIIVEEDIIFDNCFMYDTALENITIEGTIGQNGFDVQWSTKLSADSLKSIINALSTTTTGLTITLPTTAQANYEAVYGSGSWATLTATRSNWTIAYA